MIKIKRVYESSSAEDGYRVLVDKLWPRGVKKDALVCDEWAREIAPSDEIRKIFAHKDENFAAFREAYLAELGANPAVRAFAQKARETPALTLLYAAKNEKSNHAIVLKEFLENQI